MKRSKQSLAKNRLRIKAFNLWKECVFLKWGNKCEICPSMASTGHHFVPQGSCEALRYEVDNGIPVCTNHHFQHHNGNPKLHYEIIKKRGKKWAEKLLKIKDNPPHITISMAYLKSKVVELEKLKETPKPGEKIKVEKKDN